MLPLYEIWTDLSMLQEEAIEIQVVLIIRLTKICYRHLADEMQHESGKLRLALDWQVWIRF